MDKAIAAIVVSFALGGASVQPAAAADAAPAECPALLRHSFNGLPTGRPQSLCDFRGKVLVIVNTASYGGYTKQYEGLEALYRTMQASSRRPATRRSGTSTSTWSIAAERRS